MPGVVTRGWSPRLRLASSAALAGVDTDARAVTFVVAPGVGATVKATYRGLRLVRLSETPSFQGVTERNGQYELALEDILRD